MTNGITGSGLTMGVEEEFLLVDSTTAAAVACAPAVLRAVDSNLLGAGAAVHGELRPTQVEAATGICLTAEQLDRQLLAGRTAVADAARSCAVVALASGTPVAPALARPKTEPHEERFARIDRRFAGVVADYEASGCHVHVGVQDRDVAVAVVNHLCRWLPTLLALSVNSPFDRGVDTGYGSWRMVQQTRFPGAGLPPYFADFTAHRSAVSRLVDAGVLIDESMTFWVARPSPTLPTVEIRVTDTAMTIVESTAFALLARALVRTALWDLDRGVEARPVDPQLGAAALWTAARYGLDHHGLDLESGSTRPAVDLLDELVRHVRPALEDTGDEAFVMLFAADLGRRGDGARRQRHFTRGGPANLVAAMTEHFLLPGMNAPVAG